MNLSLSIPGALGADAGAASDGVLVGSITPTAMAAVVGATKVSGAAAAITNDGGTYVVDSTDFNDPGTDDVAPFPAAPAVGDAVYIGSDAPFPRADLNVSTAGVGDWTVAYEYWNGTAYAALSGVTDPTSGFSAGSTGVNSLTWTEPGDWVANTVNDVLKFWVKIRITAFTGITTQALLAQGFVVHTAPTETDLTTEANEATADDVPLTSAYPVIGERTYFGGADKFPKLKVKHSTAASGTLTFNWLYWDGADWSALTVDDPASDFSASAGTYFISFVPPSDWVAFEDSDGPGGANGYFVVAEVASASGSITAPLIEQCWTLPLTAAACAGALLPVQVTAFTVRGVAMYAQTASAAGADSKFLLVNATSGAFVELTWPDATAIANAVTLLSVAASDELLLLQVAEQGTTELADVNFVVVGV